MEKTLNTGHDSIKFETRFLECPLCSALPGTPLLCPSCLNNRSYILYLEKQNKILKKNMVAGLQDKGKGLFLERLENKLDKALSEETKESLEEWLESIKKNTLRSPFIRTERDVTLVNLPK